jgi:hypothetical protein
MMNIGKLLLLGLGFNLAIANIALADQCAYITKQQALRAMEELDVGKKVYEFCELCGDKTPKPLIIKSLSLQTVENGKYWEIKANDQGIDLAYVYVDRRGAKSNRINLAAIAQCKTTGVRRSIKI